MLSCTSAGCVTAEDFLWSVEFLEAMAEYEVKVFVCVSPGQNPWFLSGHRGTTVVQEGIGAP